MKKYVAACREMEQTAESLNMQMGEAYIENAKYIYLHDQKWLAEAIDVHHVVVRRSAAKGILVCLCVIFSWASALYLYPVKGQSVLFMCWSFLFGVFLIKLLLLEPIKKESVMVMPSFGVQLETHHVSGRVTRRFIPIDKILKPVLVECVTPVTCFWSLSLIVRGEEKLMLVFKELRPPSKMLVPIWKALCAATDSPKTPDAC